MQEPLTCFVVLPVCLYAAAGANDDDYGHVGIMARSCYDR